MIWRISTEHAEFRSNLLRDTGGSKEEIESVLDIRFLDYRSMSSRARRIQKHRFGLFGLLPVLEAYSGSRKQRQASPIRKQKLTDFVMRLI